MSNFDQNSLSAPYLLNQMVDSGQTLRIAIIGTIKRINKVLVTLTQFLRSPHYKACKNEHCLHSIS